MWNRLKMSHGDNSVNMKLFNEDGSTKVIFKTTILERFPENRLQMVFIPWNLVFLIFISPSALSFLTLHLLVAISWGRCRCRHRKSPKTERVLFTAISMMSFTEILSLITFSLTNTRVFLRSLISASVTPWASLSRATLMRLLLSGTEPLRFSLALFITPLGLMSGLLAVSLVSHSTFSLSLSLF